MFGFVIFFEGDGTGDATATGVTVGSNAGIDTAAVLLLSLAGDVEGNSGLEDGFTDFVGFFGFPFFSGDTETAVDPHRRQWHCQR